MRHWRHIPAQTVREVVEYYCHSFPPSLSEMQTLLARHHYDVCIVPATWLPSAMTDHDAKQVRIPFRDTNLMTRMLLHETAEVLLRLPIAEEFHYYLSHKDEFHEVAKLVEAEQGKKT